MYETGYECNEYDNSIKKAKVSKFKSMANLDDGLLEAKSSEEKKKLLAN